MVWAGLLGATVTFHQRSDPVLMDIPAPRSRALRIAAEALRAAAVSAFVLPLLIYSPDIVSHHTLRLTESMRWPSAYVMLIVPIFSAVILIHMILRVVCKSLGGTHATDDRKPVP
jgi:TRAP-type C4-dicarboxylate transport system permease small subunit